MLSRRTTFPTFPKNAAAMDGGAVLSAVGDGCAAGAIRRDPRSAVRDPPGEMLGSWEVGRGTRAGRRDLPPGTPIARLAFAQVIGVPRQRFHKKGLDHLYYSSKPRRWISADTSTFNISCSIFDIRHLVTACSAARPTSHPLNFTTSACLSICFSISASFQDRSRYICHEVTKARSCKFIMANTIVTKSQLLNSKRK